MISQDKIERVTRLSKAYVSRMTKHGSTLDGPYWYGWYQENGKPKKVYIGRELPKELKRLIQKRYRRRGHRNYTWPRPKG